MARRASIWYERNFDREANFVVNKRFPLDGTMLFLDQPFDKTRVSTRKLRQLFEQRRIRFADGERRPAPPGRPLRTVRMEAAATLRRPEEEKSLEETPISPFEVRHFGQGRWAVVQGEERMTDWLAKPAAEAALERMQKC